MKPFRILGIQQIAIGGPDKQRLRSLWVGIFGLAVKSSFVSERENVDEDICAIGSGAHAVEVDLSNHIFIQKFLDLFRLDQFEVRQIANFNLVLLFLL